MNIFRLPIANQYGRRLAGFTRATYLLLLVGLVNSSIIFVIIVIAAIYRKSCQLQEDQKFTI